MEDKWICCFAGRAFNYLFLSMLWTSACFLLDVDNCRPMQCCSSTKCKLLRIMPGTFDVGIANMQAIDDEARPCLVSVDRSMQVMNDVDRPWLTLINWCVQAMDDARRSRTMSADGCVKTIDDSCNPRPKSAD